MKQKFVSQKQSQQVIDGFKASHQKFVEDKSFNAVEFKNFMEPIFTEAGYRNDAKSVGGGMKLIFL